LNASTKVCTMPVSSGPKEKPISGIICSFP
jgi:hypothetical protein